MICESLQIYFQLGKLFAHQTRNVWKVVLGKNYLFNDSLLFKPFMFLCLRVLPGPCCVFACCQGHVELITGAPHVFADPIVTSAATFLEVAI